MLLAKYASSQLVCLGTSPPPVYCRLTHHAAGRRIWVFGVCVIGSLVDLLLFVSSREDKYWRV